MKRNFTAVPGKGIFAATSDDMKAEIIKRLSVPGVESVALSWSSPTQYRGKLSYTDGTTSMPFTANFSVGKNIDKDAPPAFEWNPEYTVESDGSVWLNNKRVGWIPRIVTRKPLRVEYDYRLDSILITYGGKSVELTEYNGEDVADMLK